MESSTTLEIINKIENLGIKFIDYSTLSKITQNYNQNSIQKIISRLQQKNILQKLYNGKYLYTKSKTTDFETANYLYQPSYISLQSALSFYGILPQFVYSITSITTKKTRALITQNKEFTYGHITASLFHHYTKTNNFLIALPEKALFDSLYMASKGLISLDINELDLSIINKTIFKKLCKNYPKLKL
ncbi:hypothetical protein KKE47_03075 [Patescibacteria group bacterium]|nr:hypothetical protein [Patescibacteria group bacterium]MCG2701974.1 hypothetical protein [Candidatus Parcubacteria bacterium]MBU4265024.1 hypothetical protein [Patescibacteria group bacterium]MBU4390177.1 hypothetical protein [Patescibacteria group bacterium]MBU4431580.1 hypothetical protein [Patescibacteria group bacterium]